MGRKLTQPYTHGKTRNPAMRYANFVPGEPIPVETTKKPASLKKRKTK